MITATTEPDQHALDDRALAAVGEEEHEREDHARDEEEHDPELGRDHADGAVDAIEPRFLARGGLVEPLVVGGLLGRRLRLHGLQRAEQPHAPRVDRVSLRAGAHPVPLAVDDRAPVADELAGELAGGRSREELCVLDLLDDDQRLLLGAAARLVVAREGEEDDEPEQHREPGRQHAEDPRRAIAVLEVAALGCPRRTSSIAATATAVTAAMIRAAQTTFTSALSRPWVRRQNADAFCMFTFRSTIERG